MAKLLLEVQVSTSSSEEFICEFTETSLALKIMTLKQELRELYRFSALLKYYKNS